MTHMRLKILVAGAVLVAAVTYLGFAGMAKGGAYTMPVDKYVTSAGHNVRVRLCGKVSEQEMDIQKGKLSAKFIMKGEHSEVHVAYKGVVPDMFKAGAEVVAEGKEDGDGVFVADVLMTKCASKYEERPAGHPDVGNSKIETQNTKQETRNEEAAKGGNANGTSEAGQ